MYFFKTKLDPVGATYKLMSVYGRDIAQLDASAGTTASLDRMLSGARVYEQIGESCCGEAEAQAASALTEIQGSRQFYSAIAAYYYARLEEYKFIHGELPDPDSLVDDGTFPWAVLTAWQKHGLPYDSEWPRDPALLNKPPSWGAVVESMLHTTSDFYLIDATGAQLADGMDTALRANHPINVTVPVDRAMLDHVGSEPLGPREGTRLGLHRMPILGKTSSGDYISLNSWGSGWGAGGLCYLTPWFIMSQAKNIVAVSGVKL